jgi:site-specific recombinase XerD
MERLPITSLQKLMGHADLTTTQIYINLFLDDIRAEYEKAIHRIEARYAALSKKSAS